MLEVFIQGELVDLAIPTEEFARGDIWYRWFNDWNINRYLAQGAYPNTRDLQSKFFNSIGSDRLVLIVQNKSGIPFGVTSLSFIDQTKKTCDNAIVVDSRVDTQISGIASLEAVSIMVKHGFESLGMKRISGGQHVNLRSWQQRLELLGFKIEGIHENQFIKGNEVSNSVAIACLYCDYLEILKRRSGRLWDGKEKMLTRIRNLPKKSFRDELDEIYKNSRKAYYDNIWDL